MNLRTSQSILKEKCEKSLSSIDKERLAQSWKSTSKRGILPKTNNSIKGNGVDRKLTQRNNTTRRSEVSVEFAAKQLFQILLVDIKYRNAKLNNKLEPIPSAICGQVSEN